MKRQRADSLSFSYAPLAPPMRPSMQPTPEADHFCVQRSVLAFLAGSSFVPRTSVDSVVSLLPQFVLQQICGLVLPCRGCCSRKLAHLRRVYWEARAQCWKEYSLARGAYNWDTASSQVCRETLNSIKRLRKIILGDEHQIK